MNKTTMGHTARKTGRQTQPKEQIVSIQQMPITTKTQGHLKKEKKNKEKDRESLSQASKMGEHHSHQN